MAGGTDIKQIFIHLSVTCIFSFQNCLVTAIAQFFFNRIDYFVIFAELSEFFIYSGYKSFVK